MVKVNRISVTVALIALFLVMVIIIMQINKSGDVGEVRVANPNVAIPSVLARSELKTDFSNSSIELDQILSGGPGKDGIPALSDPGFVRIEDSEIGDETQVIYVENNGEGKIYPYSIIVWHEIVNDNVGGVPLAITFCPLCGSAIVFERDVDGQVLDFGVSGFLYQSNLLMYSRDDSETLWSQSLGEAVAGAKTGQTLTHFPFQLLSYSDTIEKHPDALVLSTNTGYSRDYKNTPYSGYEDTEQTNFPVSVTDKRFPAKEVFYIVPLEGNSVAVRTDKADGTYEIPDSDVVVIFDKGLVTAKWGDAVIPGYYEMWFSWATHNQDTGIVIN